MAKKNKGFGYTESPRPMICMNPKCRRRFTPSLVNGKVKYCDHCRKSLKG